MRVSISRLALMAGLALVGAAAAARADDKPIKIGVDSPIQLQVGRDTVDSVQMGIDEINAKGGVLGRELAMAVADETMDPQQGVAAINKLTADDQVDVLIGGYNSGVTLAQEPHIADAKTIWLGVGSASPAITNFVKTNYKRFKYMFRVGPLNAGLQGDAVADFMTGKIKGGYKVGKVAIVGENAKWVQDLTPILKTGLVKGGLDVTMENLFDPDMSDFTPVFAKVKESGAQYLVVILSHAASDVFVKQWYDAKMPIPIGGIDVKSQDSDFFTRVSGKAISETVELPIMPAALTAKTMPYLNAFNDKYHRQPVYTGPNAYDALHMYVEAVTRAGSTDPEKVIPELEKSKYLGTQGIYEFDETHDVKTGPGLINELFVQWQDGGKRAIVWPQALATGTMIAPPWMNKM
jgi:branched-chain amino acid transport system substrate-binding protein